MTTEAANILARQAAESDTQGHDGAAMKRLLSALPDALDHEDAAWAGARPVLRLDADLRAPLLFEVDRHAGRVIIEAPAAGLGGARVELGPDGAARLGHALLAAARIIRE